jgi:hypothetical protein
VPVWLGGKTVPVQGGEQSICKSIGEIATCILAMLLTRRRGIARPTSEWKTGQGGTEFLGLFWQGPYSVQD